MRSTGNVTMKSQFSLALVALLLALIGTAQCQAQSDQDYSQLAPSQIQTTSIGGRSVDVFHTPGWKVVYFFSSTCPCVAACEQYSFLPMEKKYGSDITFFAVDSDSYDLGLPKSQLSDLVSHHHLPYSVILDPRHDLAKYLQATVTPETFVIDPEGNVVFSGMPDDSRRFLVMGKSTGAGVTRTFLSTALAEGMAGKPVTQPDIPLAGCIIAY